VKTTYLPQVTDKLYHIMFSTSPLAGLEPTTLVMIGTDCKGSCNMQLPYDYDRDVPQADCICSSSLFTDMKKINPISHGNTPIHGQNIPILIFWKCRTIWRRNYILMLIQVLRCIIIKHKGYNRKIKIFTNDVRIGWSLLRVNFTHNSGSVSTIVINVRLI